MAEPGSGAQEGDATQETAPSAESIQPQGFTPEELQTLIGQVVGGQLSAMQRQFDQRLTSVEQLRPQIEAVMGTSRRTEAMVQRVFRGNATEEDVAEFEEAFTKQEAEQRFTNEVAAAVAERDALKYFVSNQDGGDSLVWDTTFTLAMERGRDEGLDAERIRQLMPKNRTAGPGDPFGYKRLFREWSASMRADSLKRERDAEPSVAPVTVRGGGASGETPLSAYQKALRDGGDLPSKAEIDAITARYR